MFKNLPESIQQQIIIYLESDNFCAARDLRDAFIKRQNEEQISPIQLVVASQKSHQLIQDLD